jgi:hypothetical protein
MTVDDCRLVLVEGFPGSGKSTTAQWLARQRRRAGRPARWFYEQQADHPVVGIPTGAEYPTWGPYFDYRRARWAAFVAEARHDDAVTVMESALLQYSVFVTLRRGVAPDDIVAFLTSVVPIIRPLAPRLVYLAAPDPEAAYRDIIERRGGPALVARLLPAYDNGDAGAFFRERGLRGYEGLVAYWREHAAVCERAIAALGLPTLIVDPRDADWPGRRASIARFLGFKPSPEPSPPITDLARWTGRYRVDFKGGTRECVVRVADGRLVVDGLLWPGNRLLPAHGNVFEAEAWPFELVFDVEAAGGVGRLTLRGPACSTP